MTSPYSYELVYFKTLFIIASKITVEPWKLEGEGEKFPTQ